MMRLGLLARQAPLGLRVPRWLFISVSDDIAEAVSTKLQNSYSQMAFSPALVDDRGVDMLIRIARGMAVAGATGVSIVGRWEGSLPSGGMNETLIGEAAMGSRPFFGYQFCDVQAARRSAAKIPGELAGVYITSGFDGGQPPRLDFLGAEEAVVVDSRLLFAGVTRNPLSMVRQVTEGGAAEPGELRNYKDRVSEVLLRECCSLLATYLVCRPATFGSGALLFASEFIDSMIAGAFNELNLRARWDKAA